MIMEIEGFDSIISTLSLAKELYDIDRYDIVEKEFFKTLCWDGYFENVIGVISSVFSGYYSNYNEDDAMEIMVFNDDVISNYFIHAYEQIKLQKLPFDENPYVTQAQDEVRRCLYTNSCIDYKLLAYTKTKKTARQSRILVGQYTDCGCNAMENLAFGLIRLYTWFADKCDEFKALEISQNKTKEAVPHICVKSEMREVMAA